MKVANYLNNKSNQTKLLALLILLALISCISSESDEDIVSIEEITDFNSYDSSEIFDGESLISNDFDDELNGQSSQFSFGSQVVGLLEEKKIQSGLNSNNRTRSNSTLRETKIDCTLVNLTDSEVPSVKIVNTSGLLEYISPLFNESTSNCAFVLFYYPWCPFSAKSAKHFNALGKLFPQLNILALDAYQHNSINMRFGLVGIPTFLFFHNGKMVAKYNNTDPSLGSLALFVTRLTGLEPDPRVNLTSEDVDGPVPIVPQPTFDYVLGLSTIFVTFFLCYSIVQSTLFKRIVESIRATWREAEAQHQHMD